VACAVLASCKRKEPSLDAPSPVVVAFYTARIASGTTGAPSAEVLRQFAPLLSDTLTALLRAAGVAEERAINAAPGEKPPFAEGDLYSSLFEGPTKFSLVRDTIAARQRKVVVRFIRVDNGASYTWTDTVQLGKKGRYDVIDDIRYGGAGEFGNHGSLRESLEASLAALMVAPAPATSTAPPPKTPVAAPTKR
jgi:hypothetical protein